MRDAGQAPPRVPLRARPGPRHRDRAPRPQRLPIGDRLDGAPVSAAEFDALLEPLGPFPADRRVMVAVSGGADSMALAWLLAGWGHPLAAIVDHGLRAGSAAEAALVARRLEALSIPSIVLRAGLERGPAMAERARDARYALLLAACRAQGRPDLFLGHHRGDQAETVRMRQLAGSGPAGLAGMSPRAFREEARLLRPLLGLPPGRLRATLWAAGLDWVEDPSNQDASSQRVRVRQGLGEAALAALAALAGKCAKRRMAVEREAARALASVEIRPEGFALAGAPLPPAALESLIWVVSGRRHPPPRGTGSAGLAPRTVAGVQIGSWRGRALIAREPAAVAPPVPAAGALWDGRFRVLLAPADVSVGALGDAAAGLRGRSGLPSTVLRTLPALRRGDRLWAVPHIDFPDAETCRSVSIVFGPSHQAGGAFFLGGALSR